MPLRLHEADASFAGQEISEVLPLCLQPCLASPTGVNGLGILASWLLHAGGRSGCR